ncbi:hypothetical protein WJX81_008455 [Elliptochloris bilobata]|uniref:HIT-type domain-containing protein n=1 Tax=Elliptochloris bilobata TaxID=381761 RepID=A0AAW1QAH3_9CHLO
MAADTQGVCRVCLKQFARYTCPRCNLRYCSLPCYQKHGPRCTESFYREHVETDLRDTNASADERQCMLDILHRVQQQQDAQGGGSASGDDSQDDAEEAPCELSEQTLAKLLLRAEAGEGELEVAPGDLTTEERSAFERAVAAGALRGMLAPWQPWWLAADAGCLALSADGTALVHEAAGEGLAAAPIEDAPPPPPAEPLPRLSALTPRAPSPLLRWQLPQLLYAYCAVMRLFNGDYRADALEAAAAALAAAPVLEGTTAPAERAAAAPAPASPLLLPPESVPEALLPCVEAAAGPALFGAGSRGAAVGVLADVAMTLAMGRPAA